MLCVAPYFWVLPSCWYSTAGAPTDTGLQRTRWASVAGDGVRHPLPLLRKGVIESRPSLASKGSRCVDISWSVCHTQQQRRSDTRSCKPSPTLARYRRQLSTMILRTHRTCWCLWCSVDGILFFTRKDLSPLRCTLFLSWQNSQHPTPLSSLVEGMWWGALRHEVQCYGVSRRKDGAVHSKCALKKEWECFFVLGAIKKSLQHTHELGSLSPRPLTISRQV